MALGKNFVQAKLFVYALQCQTGKVENRREIADRPQTIQHVTQSTH